MNHYLPPQARIQASMAYSDDAYRVQIWNPRKPSPPAPVNPSYYPRHAATPVPVQTAGNAESWRVISPPKPPFTGPKTSSSSSSSPPSVKHLTCYFWAKNGVCKWTDDECLYAHYNTGKTANGPLQVEPGRPAVAGKNATNSRPVYEDWRGGQDSSRTRGMYGRGIIEPEIQEQIDHIAAKERARSNNCALSTDPVLHRQMETIKHSMGAMSTVLQQSLTELCDISTQVRAYGLEVLEIARALDVERSPQLNRLTTVAQGMIAIMSKSANAESIIQQTKECLVKDLDKVDLIQLVPEWEIDAKAKGRAA